MTTFRVTQTMMSERSLSSLQLGLGRLAKVQEQLSTGRVLNRPSDSPTDTTAAMRLRTTLSTTQQHVRSAQDGIGWLGQIDDTLMSMTSQVRRARELALTGANEGAMGPTAREALAAEVDQIRAGVASLSNSSYLGRPVFGGITAGSTAYDAAGTWVGTPGAVNRTVGDGVVVRADVEGPAVFGPDGDSLFTDLERLSTALRANDQAEISTLTGKLAGRLDKITSTLADVGTRYARLDEAAQLASDRELTLTSSLSEIENVDLPRAMVDLQLQEVAYQAALASTARVMQPSLLEFLR